MKVLLINPPVRHYAFPHGLGYIASCLLDEGHNVNVLDIDGHMFSPKQVEQKLKNYDFDVVGITGIITTYTYVKWLTRVIRKQYQVPIVVGGAGATSIPRLYLEKANADVIVVGEGENTVRGLFQALENNANLSDVSGILYKKGKAICQTQQRKPIEELDNIPHPAWHLFPMDVYTKIPIISWLNIRKPYRNIGISTARGCPFNCHFCYHNFQGYKARLRSPDSIIEEIKILLDKYEIDFFAFVDDLFVISRKRVLEFCRKVKEENLDIKWGTSARVDLVDQGLLKLMASAGCIYLSYGFESGSQKILDNMNKKVTVEQNRKAIKLTKEVGICVDGSFMIGYPGETKETLSETTNFIKEVGLEFNSFFFTTPYPGTQLWEYAKETGKIPRDEEKIILKYGEMTENLLVNFTDFSDRELIEIKKKLENELNARARKNLRLVFKDALELYKTRGFIKTFKKGLERIRSGHF